jgi:hypothetical protein
MAETTSCLDLVAETAASLGIVTKYLGWAVAE